MIDVLLSSSLTFAFIVFYIKLRGPARYIGRVELFIVIGSLFISILVWVWSLVITILDATGIIS